MIFMTNTFVVMAYFRNNFQNEYFNVLLLMSGPVYFIINNSVASVRYTVKIKDLHIDSIYSDSSKTVPFIYGDYEGQPNTSTLFILVILLKYSPIIWRFKPLLSNKQV